MKPLRLTLDAVGPYPGRQVIDFSAALESRLFGIYGPTGAGKSTIFSAMTFALFGEAAKAEQHASTLRSDHAEPTRKTEVEFIFEADGRVFRIVRNPEQMRPAKRGGGETREGHKATLFDVTGLDLATVCDTLPGKVVAEGKLDVVNKQIIGLLGYGPAQFRQIVLLPQGQFEKFLAVNTQERVRILRDLFDVSLYRRLAEQVKTNADSAEAQVKTAREVCGRRLSAEGFSTRDELAAGIGIAQSDLILHREAAAAAKTRVDGTTQAYQTAALTDQAFTEHVEADKALQAVAAEGETIAGHRHRVSRARAAQLLSDVELSVGAARKAVDDMTLLATAAAQFQEEAESEARTATERLGTLTAKAAAHESDKVDVQNCDSHAKRLEASTVLQEAASKAIATALALQSARSYERSRSQLANDRQALDRLDSQAAAAVEQLGDSEAAFSEAEAALLKNHALHVAAHLADGEPCPACGSRKHPSPAHGVPQAGAVAETYQREKTAFEGARKRCDEARTLATAARETLVAREAEHRDIAIPARVSDMLDTELAGIVSALQAIGPDVDLDALDAQRLELDAVVATALSTYQTNESAAQSSNTAAALARQSLEAALQSVPLELRDQKRLSEKQAALARKIGEFVAAVEGARKHERDTNNALIKARSATQHAANNKALAETQLKAAHASFAERLSEAGLTNDDYRSSKADIPLITDIERKIADHQERHIRADERLQKAARAVENADRPDIKTLKDAKEAAELALASANDLAASTNARVLHLEKLTAELAVEISRLDRLEQETAPLRELADAFTGRNDMKMNLETFAIATMFDHVLEAANLRLGPMTRNRYTFVRETEGRGNAQRGLDIAIDDADTGRPRPPSTLSGGETFIAALALALGLSDVVESTRGNVRLDTIFIDEGFGSLDADGDAGTLEQVLETLQDLVGHNRAVGLISHVPLVQQAIPNGFWITKTASGSHVEMRS
jgi:exonuclease SbcC